METGGAMTFPLHEQASCPLASPIAKDAATSRPADEEARQLAAQVARGDDDAFQRFYDQYQERLLRFTLVLSRGDEALACDIVQKTMLTAAAKLKPVRSEAHLWHWLARVARQHLIKEWRRRRQEPAFLSLMDEMEEAGKADSFLAESLNSALQSLPEEDRQAVEWFYFDGLSHSQIAELTASTPKAASSRLERARTKLRSLLNRILSHET
jgi:RNA polymerase sigma-70 factor (ECF subfamily)